MKQFRSLEPLAALRALCAVPLLICTALAALTLPMRAHAQFTAKATATGQFESDSNVFDLESGGPPLPGTVGLRRSDTFYAYGADVDGGYLWGRQQFYTTASATKFDYQHLTQLDHDDYKVDGGLIWQSGALLDGKVSLIRSHSMVPFLDVLGSGGGVTILDELRGTALVNYQLNPNWKTVGTALYSIADQTNAEGLVTQLKQTTGTGAIDYLGLGPLTYGLKIEYTSGSYDGYNGAGTINPSFTQSTIGLLADYKHIRTVFEGQVGFSRRQSDDGSDNTSGYTGVLSLKQQLTPKTSVTAKIDRTINSYLLNSSSEIDSEAGMGFNWQATYKLTGSVAYTFTYRDFPKQGNNPVGSNRVDIQEYWNLGIQYQPARWLVIKPYSNLQARRSTLVGGAFSSTVFGVNVTVSRR